MPMPSRRACGERKGLVVRLLLWSCCRAQNVTIMYAFLLGIPLHHAAVGPFLGLSIFQLNLYMAASARRNVPKPKDRLAQRCGCSVLKRNFELGTMSLFVVIFMQKRTTEKEVMTFDFVSNRNQGKPETLNPPPWYHEASRRTA